MNAPLPDPEKSDRWFVPAIIASQFAPPFLFSGVAIGLPELGAEVGASAVELGLVETLFLAGSLAFLLPVGKLADASDKRTLYRIGVLGFTVTAFLIAASSSIEWILALRFLQGMLAAVFTVTGPAILADVVPPAQRGRAFGASIGVIYAGLSLGPICAGFLAESFGWRSIFAVGAVLLLVTYAPVHSRLNAKWRAPQSKAVDVSSVALLFIVVATLVYGVTAISHPSLAASLLGASALSSALFVARQRRLPNPLVDLKSIGDNELLRAALVIQLALYLNAYCTTYLHSLALQVTYARSERTAGFVIALGSVLMAVVAPLSGRWSDRIGKRRLANAGVACVLGSALLGLTLDADSSLAIIVTIVTVQGVGFALFSSPNMALIMNAAPAAATSTASALAAMARSMGMVAGMLIVGLLVSISIGDSPIADHGDSLMVVVHRTYWVLSIVSAIALALGLRAARASRSIGADQH